jgi:hypothetical protein
MSVGVENIKKVGTLLKLGVIAILQEVAKDGFQATDILAPLKSKTFNDALQPVLLGYKDVLSEAADLGPLEIFGLAQSAYSSWGDIKTELDLALAKTKVVKG